MNEPDLPSAGAGTLGVTLETGRLSADLPEADLTRLREAVLAHGYVVLRDQRLPDDELLALGRRFGAIEERVVKYSTVGPSRRQSPTLWHHHNCCDGALDDWILFYTPAIPDVGGSIEFFDAAAWFERLDAEDQSWARNRRARHDYAPVEHAGVPPVAHPPWHPLVAARETAGRPLAALYVGAHAMEIEGVPDLHAPPPHTPWHRVRSAALAQDLYQLHDARAHDLILWDMKRVAHRSHPWAGGTLRVIHEVIVRTLAE